MLSHRLVNLIRELVWLKGQYLCSSGHRPFEEMRGLPPRNEPPAWSFGARFVDGASSRTGKWRALGYREATAILSWRHSEVLYEKAPHRADVTEPGSRTDVLDWEIGLLEQSPRLVDPDATHEICRRLVEVSAAPAAERTRAHANRIRKTRHRQRLVEVLEDERVDVVVPGRDPFLAAECGAELRLTSRSSQK